jgi:hypothetical protein
MRGRPGRASAAVISAAADQLNLWTGQAVRVSAELTAVGQQAGAIEFSDGVSSGTQHIH